jgi:hypothetical protein
VYSIRDLLGHFVKVPPSRNQDGMCPHKCCRGKRPHPENWPVLLDRKTLRTASEAELLAHYQREKVGESGRAVSQVLGELQRREDAERAREARKANRATRADEYRAYLENQWTTAEEATRGNMLNKRGRARGMDPRALWTAGTRERERYASDELREWFARNPVVTQREFHGDAAAAAGARRRRGHSDRLYGVY